MDTKAITRLSSQLQWKLIILLANGKVSHDHHLPETKVLWLSYGLFEQNLQDKRFVGNPKYPAARLFAQFHAPQTKQMKKCLKAEVKKGKLPPERII